jgi:serine/threonine-protein kinase
MGMVYRGWDEVLEREVAVKTLTVEGTLDEESRQRFQIEARAAARLQHANIVTVFELGEDRGLPFIAMELLPGVDLETLVRSGEPLLLEEKLEIMVQVLRGLHFAHEHGIVHRDIKPGNIMLVARGQVKIMDFGIARMRVGDVKTSTGIVLGTPKYMSPEQVEGSPVDQRSDIFSLGIVLYEMLTGVRLFSGEDAPQIMHNVAHGEHEPPTRVIPGLPAMLDFIVARALKKDPTVRYQDAYDLAADLATCLAELRAREEPAGENGKKTGKDTTRTVKLEVNDKAPAARAIGFDTRLPLSRQFDCAAALERLEAPSRRDRGALARAPRAVGIFRRLWNDRAPRRFLALVLVAALAGAYIAFA